MSESPRKSDIITVSAPPQTPRNNALKTTTETPSFSFGLGFLPSFLFGSPRNGGFMSSFSPQSFFQASTSLIKDIMRKKDELDPVSSNNNVFNTFTPPHSQKLTSKFLDSMSSSSKKSTTSRLNDVVDTTNATDNEVDIWLLGYDNNHTTLTSIYEENSPGTVIKKEPGDFLTPNKLFLKKDDLSKSFTSDSHKLEEPQSPNAKRRKIVTEKAIGELKNDEIITESSVSSSDRVALQAETVASPRRRKLDSSRRINSWTAELSNVLLSLYHKYNKWRENQPLQSPMVQSSSIYDVLAKMLFKKTQIEKSPEDIEMQLAILQRGEEDLIHGDVSNDLRPISKSEALHKSLSSSPFGPEDGEEDRNDVKVSVLQKTNQNIKSCPRYKIEPLELSLQHINGNDVHTFTKFDSKSDNVSRNNAISIEDFSDNFNHNFQEDLKPILALVQQNGATIWTVAHLLSTMRDVSSITPASYMLPFTSTPINKHVNLDVGEFKAFMKLRLSGRKEDIDGSYPMMLNWKCNTRIYKDDRIVYNVDESINGYGTGDKEYELQMPFLKNFWSGYLTYLTAAGDGLSVSNLTILQTIHDPNESNSPPWTYCLIHTFNATEGSGNAVFQEFKLNNTSTGNNITALVSGSIKGYDFEDDNATEIANSSPCKTISPSKSEVIVATNLKIDASRANTLVGLGPSSAPIYNANLLHRQNHGVLKMKDGLKTQRRKSSNLTHSSVSQVEQMQLQIPQVIPQEQNLNNQLSHHFQQAASAFQNQLQMQMENIGNTNNVQMPRPPVEHPPHPMLTASQSTGNIHHFIQQQQRAKSINFGILPELPKGNFTGVPPMNRQGVYNTPVLVAAGTPDLVMNSQATMGAQQQTGHHHSVGSADNFNQFAIPGKQQTISPTSGQMAAPGQHQFQMLAGNSMPPQQQMHQMPRQIQPQQQPQQQQPQQMPVSQIPVSQMPVNQMPVNQMPVNRMPVNQMPVNQMHVNQLPVNQMSNNQQMQHQAPPMQPLQAMQQHQEMQVQLEQQLHQQQGQQHQQQQDLMTTPGGRTTLSIHQRVQSQALTQQEQIFLIKQQQMQQLQQRQQRQLQEQPPQHQFQHQVFHQPALTQQQMPPVVRYQFELDRREQKPREITFCPIVEYDPSSNPDAQCSSSQSKSAQEGTLRFPTNTQVSMYKPKKK